MFEHNQIFLVVTRQSVCQHMLMEPSWKFDQLTFLEESATSETTTSSPNDKFKLEYFTNCFHVLRPYFSQHNRMRKLYGDVSCNLLGNNCTSEYSQQYAIEQLNLDLKNVLHFSCKTSSVMFFSTRGELSR